jgi:hypothetical protein
MAELTTTPNRIRVVLNPYIKKGWWWFEGIIAGLLRKKTRSGNTPLTLLELLESSGLDGAVLALQSVEGHDEEIQLFAEFCVKFLLDLFEHERPGDMRPRQAVETAERYMLGEVTESELAVAGAALYAVEYEVFEAFLSSVSDEDPLIATYVGGMDFVSSILAGIAGWVALGKFVSKSTAWAAWFASRKPVVVWDVWLAWVMASNVTDIFKEYAGYAALNDAREIFQNEFIQFCRLEGRYGRES